MSEYLARLAENESRAEARKRIRELSEKSTLRLCKKTWSRDDLYRYPKFLTRE